jgi:hypothetical protein
MIEFNEKSFAGIGLEENMAEVHTLKDFPQESIYQFIKFKGKDLYQNEIFNTQPVNTKFGKLKSGRYRPAEFKSVIGAAMINHPASHRDYLSKDWIEVGKGKVVQDFDLVFKVCKNGLIVAPEFDQYLLLLYTLSKYCNGEFDYKFVERGSNYPSPIITVPKDRSGIDALVMALTEFLVGLKLFTGNIYKIRLIEEDVKEAKNFSVIEKITQYIPSMASALYKLIIQPIMKKRVEMKWDKANKASYSPALIPNLTKYIEKEYKTKLVVADCTPFSYFLNLTQGKDAEKLREMLKDPKSLAMNNIDPNRKRCAMDWWAYGAQGIDNDGKPRDVILISDLDPVPAVFHEVGHFLQNNEKWLGSLQRASHSGVFSDEFVTLSSFLLGFMGSMAKSAVPEVISYVTSLLLKFPLLQSEFMASYYGLQLMKKLGATEKDLTNAKFALKTAFSTYVMGVINRGANSGYGRLTGELLKMQS